MTPCTSCPHLHLRSHARTNPRSRTNLRRSNPTHAASNRASHLWTVLCRVPTMAIPFKGRWLPIMQRLLPAMTGVRNPRVSERMRSGHVAHLHRGSLVYANIRSCPVATTNEPNFATSRVQTTPLPRTPKIREQTQRRAAPHPHPMPDAQSGAVRFHPAPVPAQTNPTSHSPPQRRTPIAETLPLVAGRATHALLHSMTTTLAMHQTPPGSTRTCAASKVKMRLPGMRTPTVTRYVPALP